MKILKGDELEPVRDTTTAFPGRVPDLEVPRACDQPSALDRVRRYGSFDLILGDEMMPGVNGQSGSGMAGAILCQKGKVATVESLREQT